MEKQDKKDVTKVVKKIVNKGKSATGKPIDPIDLNPDDESEKNIKEVYATLDVDSSYVNPLPSSNEDIDEGDPESYHDLDEAPLTIMQRRKRAQIFKRYRSKIKRGRDIAKRKMADLTRLKKRARKAAISLVRKRYAGEKGMQYATLSPSEKIQVDKRIEGKKKLIDKLAVKLLPKIRKAEVVRLSTMRSKKVNEEVKGKQLVHHGQETKNFDICPSALSAFDKNQKDGMGDKPGFHDAVVAVDNYLGFEKKLSKKGSASKLDLQRMNQLVDDAKAKIQKAGLKGHDYHDVHINAVKELVNAKSRLPESTTTPQDKDIEGRKGTQPAKYHVGLSPSTKAKRDAQFKKQSKMADDDPKAYKPAPGDATAKTKPSKFTQWYKQTYDEQNDAVDRTSEKHKREKENLKRKHDREMDAARLKDTRAINREQLEIDPNEFFDLIDEVVNRVEGIELSEKSNSALAKKAEKSGISLSTLRKVYNRGVAAWKTGHRPGTTPQQWGYARVNAFIAKKKKGNLNHDTDLAHVEYKATRSFKTFMERVDQEKSAKVYAKDTPEMELPTILAVDGVPTANGEIKKPHITEDLNEAFEGMFGGIWAKPAPTVTQIDNPASERFYNGTFNHEVDIEEAIRIDEYCEECDLYEDLVIEEAEYQGKKVKLNDPIRTSEVPSKKFKVYVKNEQGNVVVVRFGDPGLSIKRDDPDRRRSFRARHKCDNPGPKWKPRYWSCYQWRSGAKVDN